MVVSYRRSGKYVMVHHRYPRLEVEVVWYLVEFKVGWGSGKSPDTACERPIVLPEFRVLDREQ